MTANIGFSPKEPENIIPSSPNQAEPSKPGAVFQKATQATDLYASGTKIQSGKSGGTATARVNTVASSIISPELGQEQVEATMPADPLHFCSNAMKARVQQVTQSLHISSSGATIEERLAHLPAIPGAKGVGGSYFVGPKNARSLLIKPVIQEPGMRGTTEEPPNSTIKPGTGAIRERMAYAIQEQTGMSFGIPETTVHPFVHEMLGLPSEITKYLENIKELTSITIAREKVVELVNSSPDGTFCTAFDKHLEAELNKVVPDRRLRQKLDKKVAKLASKLQEGLSTIKKNSAEVEKAGMGIYNSLKNPTQRPTNQELCSAQTFESGCVSFDSIVYAKDSTEIELIPQLEFEKLLFDCLSFNMDRHLGNILPRKVTLEDIDKQMPQASPSEKERLLALKQHAESKGSDYAYELILIDHGTAFPDPEAKNVVRDELLAQMLWRDLPQAAEKVSEVTKARILQIDPATLAEKIQEDQVRYEAKYGESCSVSDSTFSFQRYCCMALQEGICQDKTMDELASLYADAPDNGFLEIYETEIRGKEQVDWDLIKNKMINLVNAGDIS